MIEQFQQNIQIRTIWYAQEKVCKKDDRYIIMPDIILKAILEDGIERKYVSRFQAEILHDLIFIEQGALKEINTISGLAEYINWDLEKPLSWKNEECKNCEYKEKCTFNKEEDEVCEFWKDKDDAFVDEWEEMHPPFERLTVERLNKELTKLFEKKIIFESNGNFLEDLTKSMFYFKDFMDDFERFKPC